MADFVVSDIPAGYELLSDTETFLDNLNNEEANVIYGGKKFQVGGTPYECPTGIAVGTVLTAHPVCITNPSGSEPILWEPEPIHKPPIHGSKPKPRPKARPRPTPPIKTHPVTYVD